MTSSCCNGSTTLKVMFVIIILFSKRVLKGVDFYVSHIHTQP